MLCNYKNKHISPDTKSRSSFAHPLGFWHYLRTPQITGRVISLVRFEVWSQAVLLQKWLTAGTSFSLQFLKMSSIKHMVLRFTIGCSPYHPILLRLMILHSYYTIWTNLPLIIWSLINWCTITVPSLIR